MSKLMELAQNSCFCVWFSFFSLRIGCERGVFFVVMDGMEWNVVILVCGIGILNESS